MEIKDLEFAEDLDKAALQQVAGGGVVARHHVGSTSSLTNWQYHGEASTAFLGNVYLHGKGWTKKYRTERTWSRKQIFKKYYNVFLG